MQKTAFLLTGLFPVFMLLGSAVADSAITLIALLFLLHSFRHKNWQWARQSWCASLLLLWLYMVIRSCLAEFPLEALQRSVPFVRFVLFAAALAYWTLPDAKTRHLFIKTLAITVIFLTVDGLLQRITGKDILLFPYIMDNGHIRLTGIFKKQEILGIMLTWLSFPLMMTLIVQENGNFRITKNTVFIFLLIGVIALSGERMALLLALFGWLLAACILPVRKYYLAGIIALAVVVLLMLAGLSPELFQRQFISTLHTFENWPESPYGRLLSSDLALARLHPVFGAGTNHFRIICPRLFPDPDLCNIHPHNIYLEFIIEQGVVGLALFSLFVISLYARCWQNKAALRHPLCAGFCIAMTLRLLPFISSTGFFSRWGAPPFWLVTGCLVFYAGSKYAKKSPDRDCL